MVDNLNDERELTLGPYIIGAVFLHRLLSLALGVVDGVIANL